MYKNSIISYLYSVCSLNIIYSNTTLTTANISIIITVIILCSFSFCKHIYVFI